jgi:hypothetical protein
MDAARGRFVAVVGVFVIGIAVIAVAAHRSDGDRTVSTAPEPAATTVSAGRVGFSPGADILRAPAADQARELDLMAATGAHWLRLDFPWPSIEPAAGQWRWGPFDSIVAAAQQRGFEIVGVAGYAPQWATQAAAPGVPHVDATAYGTFVGALAQRYGPRGIHVWELWNEPNLRGAWGADPDPVAYAALLESGAASARAVDPLARILSGGLAPATDAADGREIGPVTFVKGIYAAHAGGSLDAVAIHPYSYPALPRDPSTASWNTYERLPLVHDVMAANGDGAKQIWLTEFGAPTGTASGAVSLEAQSTMVRAGLLGALEWPWSGPIFWYAARDTGNDETDREANFGLVRHDFSEKPAYATFVATIDQTAGAPAPFNDQYVPQNGFPLDAREIVQAWHQQR